MDISEVSCTLVPLVSVDQLFLLGTGSLLIETRCLGRKAAVPTCSLHTRSFHIGILKVAVCFLVVVLAPTAGVATLREFLMLYPRNLMFM